MLASGLSKEYTIALNWELREKEPCVLEEEFPHTGLTGNRLWFRCHRLALLTEF